MVERITHNFRNTSEFPKDFRSQVELVFRKCWLKPCDSLTRSPKPKHEF